jgi:Recombination endonuclease VII
MDRSTLDIEIKKICSNCKIEKSINEFYNQKGRKYGKESRCIKCKLITKETHEQNNMRKIIDQKIEQRSCRICNTIKNISEFHKSKAGFAGRVAICKPCLKPITHKKAVKRKDVIRNYELKKAYGITQNDYNEMLIAQKGVCKICSIQKEETLHVDHNHTTGKIRGLLCNRCNMSLGMVKEDIIILNNMISYLINQ